MDDIYVRRKISGSTYYQRIYIQVRQFMHVIFARGRRRSHSARIFPRSFVLTCWKLTQRTFPHRMMRIPTSSGFFPPIPAPTLLHPINQGRIPEKYQLLNLHNL